MLADPREGRGSNPLPEWDATCPGAKINTIIMIITVSLFAALQNECVTTVFFCCCCFWFFCFVFFLYRLLLEVDPRKMC